MGFSLDKFFLIVGMIALPNLYYIPEYNVPLMFFIVLMWDAPYRSTIFYLLIISWFIDVFRIMKMLLPEQEYYSDAYPKLVPILALIIFVLKVTYRE